jgi:radical SAM protein with 4Fe4S-binding SPASM domain
VEAGKIMDDAAAERGRRFTHYLQSNLISYSPAWNEVLRDMFGGSLGTSMDFPNLHRKLFSGSADGYTAIWTQRLREAQAAGIDIGVIAVLHQGSIDAGADAFYRYYTEELGLKSFQVNTPFPGGPAKAVEAEFDLDKTALARFLSELFDIWMERGHAAGISLGPFDSLIHHFTGAPARLPCIWKENCSNQFISVDSKGSVAQCDCWVTSYPETFFGNVFRDADLTQMLRTSPARREFIERPKHLVEHEDCLECRFLSICHGGCPVRTYSALGTMLAKDPYCEVYKAVFGRAETHSRALLRRQLLTGAKKPTSQPGPASMTTVAIPR